MRARDDSMEIVTLKRRQTRHERRSMQPRYDNGEELPELLDDIKPEDDQDDVRVPDYQFNPKEGEALADILKRVGGPALAAKRIVQALSALTPQRKPDYRNRLEAARLMRDTCEGTPDKRPAKQDKGGDKDKPSPGRLREGK